MCRKETKLASDMYARVFLEVKLGVPVDPHSGSSYIY